MRLLKHLTITCALAASLNVYAQTQSLTLASNEGAVEQTIAGCILTELYKSIELKLNIIPMPANIASVQNQNRKVNGEVARVAAYKSKDATLTKVTPSYYSLTTAAFFKIANASVTTKDDLKKFRVGIVKGIAHAEDIVRDVPNVTDATDYTQLFYLLETNKIDVAIDTEVNGRYMVYKLRIPGVISTGLKEHELFTVLNPTGVAHAKHIGDRIAEFKSNGKLVSVTTKCEDGFFNTMMGKR